jgi:hypothetical protein
MYLNIIFEESSRSTNLPEDFKWNERDPKTEGDRKLTNLECLVHDYSDGKRVISYSLSNKGKVLTEWKSQKV